MNTLLLEIARLRVAEYRAKAETIPGFESLPKEDQDELVKFIAYMSDDGSSEERHEKVYEQPDFYELSVKYLSQWESPYTTPADLSRALQEVYQLGLLHGSLP